MAGIPNLFRNAANSKSAQWCYEQFLSRLHSAERTTRIIAACRQIRRFAAASNKKQAGIFIYFWEMNAYSDLKDIDSMWRALMAWDKAVLQKKRDLARHSWKARDCDPLLCYYAPLLYLRGHFRLGCELMETALRMRSRSNCWSFEMLWHVYRPGSRPANIYGVALVHFYSVLGRSLTEWPLWTPFVDDLHPKLLRMSAVTRSALKADPALLAPLFRSITAERRRRLFSGGTHGLRDLTDPPEKTSKRQAETKEKILRAAEDRRHQELERRLQILFPELAELPPRPGLRELLETRSRERAAKDR